MPKEAPCSECGVAVDLGSISFRPALCPACQSVRRAGYECGVLRAKRKEFVQRWRSWLTQTIPVIFLSARLHRLNPAFRAKCLSAIDGPGLVLYGPTGRGKSYAMAALLRWLLCRKKRISAMRIGAEMLNLEIRDAFKKGSDKSELDVIRPYLTPDVLLLEDLGAGKSVGAAESDFAVRVVYVLLDSRIEQDLLTLITTNKTYANLAKSFDDRIASRLSAFTWIGVGGEDKRGVK